jgi:hypothetical protein
MEYTDFIAYGYTMRVLRMQQLAGLLISLVRMSDKDQQQRTTERIKVVLRLSGAGKFM